MLMLPTAPAATARANAAPASIPEWLAALSNLPADKRAEYISSFTLAKQYIAQGNWVACDAELTTCEFIFPHNPNVWNLRVMCYIEQKRLEEASEEMKKAQAALPEDPTTLINQASLHMAKGEYHECIRETGDILSSLSIPLTQDIRDILTFRIFLCHLLQGEVTEALDSVANVSPLSDTPLYYYSRAAVCSLDRDEEGAVNNLSAATRIFYNAPSMLTPYQRAYLYFRQILNEKRH